MDAAERKRACDLEDATRVGVISIKLKIESRLGLEISHIFFREDITEIAVIFFGTETWLGLRAKKNLRLRWRGDYQAALGLRRITSVLALRCHVECGGIEMELERITP